MPATACPSRRFPGMDRAIPGPLSAKGPRPLGTRMTGMTGMTARRTHAFGRHRVPPDRPFGRCVPAGMRGRPRRVPRRSRCGSLATLPRVAFRTPSLTPAPDGERLHSMAPRGRHHSAVVTGRGLSPRVAVRTGDAPQGRVPLRAAQPGLTSTQPRRAGPTCGCRSMQDVYPCVHGVFRPPCTHGYLALRGTSPELAGRLLRPGPGRRGEGSWPLPEMCARRAARVLHLIFLAVVHRPLRHAVGGHADPERVLYAAPREATTELSPADRRLPEGAPVRVPSNVCRSVLED